MRSEVAPFGALRKELEVSQRRLADRVVGIDCPPVVFVSARNSIDDGLSGPYDQS